MKKKVKKTDSNEAPHKTSDKKAKRSQLTFVTRKEWGAPKSKWGLGAPLVVPVHNIFCLCTNKFNCYDLETCKKELLFLSDRHMQAKLCPDIKYNFVIGGDGRVYMGRGWITRPGLPMKHQNMNKDTLFIALAGTFKFNRIPSIMLESRDLLIDYGIEKNYIDEDYVMYSSLDN